jgi:hypothetical protein
VPSPAGSWYLSPRRSVGSMVSFEIYMMRDNMREVSEIGYVIYRMSI